MDTLSWSPNPLLKSIEKLEERIAELEDKLLATKNIAEFAQKNSFNAQRRIDKLSKSKIKTFYKIKIIK